ncbi:CBS domain-containing protein [Thalassotalea sp. G2M2-11]|uniref:CBS domain-containing protein n=1 Tax=Thalassotalea sp. G2M2-11 TaxID=2787627 RepID=UPI0019D2D304|nr:CBS domain-containing protein [Thalassotalea sp. G2M2-11]
MSIENIMTKSLLTLDIDDDLSDAKQLFDQYKVHHILILDGKELAGIITDRDLYKHLSPTIGTSKETPKDTALMRKKLHLIMARELITAPPSITLNEAVLLFYDNHISCLPIVNDNFQPIGIMTWRDVIKLVALQYRRKLNQQTKN